jgi:hypothetical protein
MPLVFVIVEGTKTTIQLLVDFGSIPIDFVSILLLFCRGGRGRGSQRERAYSIGREEKNFLTLIEESHVW